MNEAHGWLASTYGPGPEDRVLARLAASFWRRAAPSGSAGQRLIPANADLMLGWAEMAGIKEIVPPRLSKVAYIAPCDGGFRLSLRLPQAGQSSYREALSAELNRNAAVRWMFAHEIGHTFFFDCSTNPPTRRYGLDDHEERLCQRFAAELLLPSDPFRHWFRANDKLNIESVVAAAKSYCVPFRALVRRLITDLGLMRAVCVIIDGKAARNWRRRTQSTKCPARTAVEVIGPSGDGQAVSIAELYADPVVSRVCMSGAYSNSELEDDPGRRFFVEGLCLRSVAPRSARAFLFHSERPSFADRPLFDGVA